VADDRETWDDLRLDESFVSGAAHREGSAAERAQWARQAEKATRKAARQAARQGRKDRRRPRVARFKTVLVVAGFLAAAFVWSKVGGSERPTVQASATPTFIRVVYALPSDTPQDPTVIPAIRQEFALVQQWFESQTGGRHLRLAGDQQVISVEVDHLTISAAELRNRPDAASLVDDELRPKTTSTTSRAANEILLSFIPVRFPEQVRCGEGSEAGFAIVWMGSCGVTPSDRSSRFGEGATATIAHELVHALGAVDTCAPHYGRNGHVTDDPRDLLYDGPDEVDPAELLLDPGHDDYYQTGRTGACFDIADHPAWTG
jgi:hypothetical protein